MSTYFSCRLVAITTEKVQKKSGLVSSSVSTFWNNQVTRTFKTVVWMLHVMKGWGNCGWQYLAMSLINIKNNLVMTQRHTLTFLLPLPVCEFFTNPCTFYIVDCNTVLWTEAYSLWLRNDTCRSNPFKCIIFAQLIFTIASHSHTKPLLQLSLNANPSFYRDLALNPARYWDRVFWHPKVKSQCKNLKKNKSETVVLQSEYTHCHCSIQSFLLIHINTP